MANRKQVANYIFDKKIGRGSYATVWKGWTEEDTEDFVAVKVISRQTLTETAQLRQEVDVLRRIAHENIVRFRDLKKSAQHFYLVLEYCAGGDMSQYLRDNGKLSEEVGRKFLSQIAAGLCVLHQSNLLHRDLKPQNILLSDCSDSPRLKIADFGFARVLNQQDMAATICGSPLYMAPEILRHEPYDARADLWSTGAIYYEMIVGRPPFTGANPMQLLANIETQGRVEFEDVPVSPEGQEFERALLVRSPKDRMTSKLFAEHPYLGLDQTKIVNSPPQLNSSHKQAKKKAYQMGLQQKQEQRLQQEEEEARRIETEEWCMPSLASSTNRGNGSDAVCGNETLAAGDDPEGGEAATAVGEAPNSADDDSKCVLGPTTAQTVQPKSGREPQRRVPPPEPEPKSARTPKVDQQQQQQQQQQQLPQQQVQQSGLAQQQHCQADGEADGRPEQQQVDQQHVAIEVDDDKQDDEVDLVCSSRAWSGSEAPLAQSNLPSQGARGRQDAEDEERDFVLVARQPLFSLPRGKDRTMKAGDYCKDLKGIALLIEKLAKEQEHSPPMALHLYVTALSMLKKASNVCVADAEMELDLKTNFQRMMRKAEDLATPIRKKMPYPNGAADAASGLVPNEIIFGYAMKLARDAGVELSKGHQVGGWETSCSEKLRQASLLLDMLKSLSVAASDDNPIIDSYLAKMGGLREKIEKRKQNNEVFPAAEYATRQR